ncbi:MAG: hypothetical protein ACJ75Z_03745 [Solirubrobacterales bacterium]
MSRKRLTAMFGVLACAVTLGVVLAAPGPASAQHLGFLCNGAGTLKIEDGATPVWTVDGSGRCFDIAYPSEVRTVKFHGVGTSDPFTCVSGLNPTLISTGVVIPVTVTYTGAASGNVVTQEQTWIGPITLNRLVSPFLITENGIGADITFHRIYLQCGNNGTKPAATYDWVTLGDSPS